MPKVREFLILLTLSVPTVAAQPLPSPPPPQQGQQTQPVTREQHERDIRTLADEIKTVREQAAEHQRRHDEQDIDQPPVWSNWAMVIVTIVGGWVAYSAFIHQRDAVQLTQRADVLVDAVSISTDPGPLNHLTKISVVFKNYGPTRATNVRMNAWMEFAHIKGTKRDYLPAITMGAGDIQRVGFEAIGSFMDTETARKVRDGLIPLNFIAEVTYTDVFSKPHSCRFAGVYKPHQQVFEISRAEAD